ncbi:hypothetical protein O3M35_004162 [Rhynocoris fuscipes]|uniref:Uncharacterized protein n=1 Tax=Rhynocoris fuscipes TaxID=488301 RepID=A0AAW1CIK6_9HEMI
MFLKNRFVLSVFSRRLFIELLNCWSPLSHLVTLLNKHGDNADIFNDTLSMFKSNCISVFDNNSL